ncbi:MAG: hypothetical protein GY757_25155 [bacterium]|nr:hypothetical protein [bacterium]
MEKKIIIIGLIVAVLGVLPVHGRLFSNTTPIAFIQDGGGSSPTSVKANSHSIRELVIISAGYYFKAQKNINYLSEIVELSDIQSTDFNSLQAVINESMNNVYYSWYYYQQLIVEANRTAYNEKVIKRLSEFDYDGFRSSKALVKDVFGDVKAYLINGDVRGVYCKLAADIAEIYFIIADIQKSAYRGEVPANEAMWTLNQKCATTLLFGQYVARVFEEIK